MHSEEAVEHTLRGELTHRTVLMPPARAQAIAEGKGGGRPARPPWIVLPRRPRVIIAAAANDSRELQELHATFGSNQHIVNGMPSFVRSDKICAKRAVTTLMYSNDSDMLIVGSVEGDVVLLHPPDWSVVVVLSPPSRVTCPVRFVAPIPNGALATDERGVVRIWTIPERDCNSNAIVNGVSQTRKRVWRTQKRARPTAIAVRAVQSADGLATWAAAVGTADGCVNVVQSDGRADELCVAPSYGNARALLWSQGRLLVAAEDDCVHVVEDGRVIRVLRATGDTDGHCSFVTTLCVRGNRIVTAGMDGRVVLWHDDGFGEVIFFHEGDAFYALEWPEDRSLVASACVDEKGRCALYRIRLRGE